MNTRQGNLADRRTEIQREAHAAISAEVTKRYFRMAVVNLGCISTVVATCITAITTIN